MAYTPERASLRAYKRLKRKFQSEVFNGLGFFRFVAYWFTIRRAKARR